MAISRNRIATISEWKSNCVVAVIGDYLGEELRANKEASKAALEPLLAIFNDYYYENYNAIPVLTLADLTTLLSNRKYFPTPNHSQEILGCALRHFLKKSKIDSGSDNQLSGDAFAPLANLLQFGVKFYMLEKTENSADKALIKEMPTLAINSGLPRQLEVVWHNCVDIKDKKSLTKKDFHYDRLMPSDLEAVLHDSLLSAQIGSGATRDRQLSRDDEAVMKGQIRTALADIRAAREDEEKHEEQEHEEKEQIITPYATSSTPRRQVITPSTSLSLQHTHAADEKAVNVNSEWQEYVKKEMKTLHLENKLVDVTTLNDLEIKALTNKKAKEFNAPRKILYSLWSNQAVVVDAKTQVDWDHELAKRLNDEEEKAASCSNRP